MLKLSNSSSKKMVARAARYCKRLPLAATVLALWPSLLWAQNTTTISKSPSPTDIKQQADNCSSMKDARKRADCFEAIVQLQVKLAEKPVEVPPPIAKRPLAITYAPELKKTLIEIESVSATKDQYESQSDYWRRIEELYKKYSGQQYELRLPCSQKLKEGKPLVSYDAEKGDVVVAFSDESTGGFLKRNGKLIMPSLFYSFIPADQGQTESERYRASNSFGAQIDVEKVVEKVMGAAILAKGNNPMDISASLKGVTAAGYERASALFPKPATFRFASSSDMARALIRSCTVAMQVKSVLSDIFELKTTGMTQVRGILIESKDEKNPSMSDPLHFVQLRIALPVRMLSLEVRSESGQVVFSSSGE